MKGTVEPTEKGRQALESLYSKLYLSAQVSWKENKVDNVFDEDECKFGSTWTPEEYEAMAAYLPIYTPDEEKG